jgi:methylamine--corrinoid protein Co-methyltransferase
MGAIGCISAVTEYGQFGAYGTPGAFLPSDLALILAPSELKVDYRTLHKVVHTLNCGGMLKCDSPAMIGGMSGPPEGAVLSAVAWALLSRPILQNHAGGCQIYDVRYLANVNREGLWALSVAVQAISRNTHLITQPLANSVSGPCTDKLLYEIAAGVATIAASGGSLLTGPRTAGGKLHDYLTPLECRFLAEVGHKASPLQPEKVNAIVKELLPRYEADIKNPNVGKSLQEAYDLKTMRPTDEWEGIYRRVKGELIELGIPLDAF